MRKLVPVLVVFSVLLLGGRSAHAVNLLFNGDFELGAPGPDFPGWDVFERVPSQPGAPINNLEQPTFGGPPPDTGPGQRLAWLRPFVGNQGIFADQNVLHEAGLSQTLPAQVGETYTFKGWSRFEENYSGGLDIVNGNPSPTETIWTMEFLNSGGSLIGAPITLDIRADREAQIGFPFANDMMWYEHSLGGTAPFGTANVRVTAAAFDMVANTEQTSLQSAMFDFFSLRGAGSPETELLANADLNTGAITPPPLQGWTLTGNPENAGAQGGNFSDNPHTPGVVGYWVRGFLGSDVSASLSQRVEASEGEVFDFSAWAAFGANWSGGTDGAKPSTITLLEVAFLDDSEQEISKTSLDLWDEGLRNAPLPGTISEHPEAWEQFFINNQVAPAGTAFVEVRSVVTGAFATTDPDQAAFFDDFVLTLASVGLDGDYNGDGIVDAADYVLWRKNPAAHGGDPGGYNTWRANFGAEASGSGSGNLAAAVPEPVSWMLALMALALGSGLRRRGRA